MKPQTQPTFGTCERCGGSTTFTRQVGSAYEFDEVCPQHGRQYTVSWAHVNQPPAFSPAHLVQASLFGEATA